MSNGPEYDKLLGLASQKAQDVSALPVQQYQGQTVANMSPDTLAAMQLARSSIGSTDQVNQQALDQLNNYADYSGLQTGISTLDALGNPQNYSNTNTVSPLVNNALPSLNSSSAAYTQNLLGQYGADKTVPDVIQNYMNPYTSAVTDNIARLGTQNLTENILPNINKTFVGGGAFGGSRNSEFMSRAVRDANASILGAQSDALQAGYNNAANTAGSDLSRLTGTAENLGGQYGTDLSRNISGTQTLAGILSDAGTQDANRGLQTANTLTGLASQDANNALTASGALQNYGTNIYNQNLKDASILEGIGTTQQQQQQAQIDADVAKFNEARNYPTQQLQTLESPLQTIKFPTSTTTTTSGGGGGFGDILGALVGGASIASKAGAFAAKGGSIPEMASGGQVSPLAATWNAPDHLGDMMHRQLAHRLYANPLRAKARGGEVSGYWGNEDQNYPNYSDQEMLSHTDQHPLMYLDKGNVDMRMPMRGVRTPDNNEIRDQFYTDQKRVNSSGEFRNGGSISPLVRGYDMGGIVGDDDLWKQLQEILGANPSAMSDGAISIDPEMAHVAQTADSASPDMQQQQAPIQQDTASQPQDSQVPSQQLSPLLAGSGAPGPAPFRETQLGRSPLQSPQTSDRPYQQAALNQAMNQTPSPQEVKTAQIKALTQSVNDVDRAEMLKTGLPTTKEDFQKLAAQNLADLQKNKWSDAGLAASAGMLGNRGNFWSQLGSGIGAGSKSLEENRASQIAGYSKLADQEIKDADWKQQVALMRAQNGQNAVGNKDDSKRAELAQKMLDTLPPKDPRRAQYQKVVDAYTVGTVDNPTAANQISAPTGNIAKALAAPPALESRTVGQTYPTPRGPMIWTGNGWKPAGQ